MAQLFTSLHNRTQYKHARLSHRKNDVFKTRPVNKGGNFLHLEVAIMSNRKYSTVKIMITSLQFLHARSKVTIWGLCLRLSEFTLSYENDSANERWPDSKTPLDNFRLSGNTFQMLFPNPMLMIDNSGLFRCIYRKLYQFCTKVNTILLRQISRKLNLEFLDILPFLNCTLL